jgi:hypothetical protein
VQQHILHNCNWILFADGSAAQRLDGRWQLLLGAAGHGGEAEEFVNNVQWRRQTSNSSMER